MSTSNIASNRLLSKSLIANVTKSFRYAGVIDTIGARGPGAYIDNKSFTYNLTCGNVYSNSCTCCGDYGPPYYQCITCTYGEASFPAAEIEPSSSFFDGNPNRGYYDSSTNKGFKSFATTGNYGGNFYGFANYQEVCNCGGVDENYFITKAQSELDYDGLGEGAWAGIKEHNSTLWTWGCNRYYQLGNGLFANQLTVSPVQIGSFSWKMVSGGGRYFFAAIRYDGLLYTWGDNTYGQLGDNSTTARSSPVQIGTDTWKYVACGIIGVAAIRSDNTLWTWGYNERGMLGDGTTVNRSSPVQISGGGQWQYVVSIGNSGHAIKTDGTLWSWGWNNSGQLGDGTTVDRSSPVQVSGGGTWSHVMMYNGFGNGNVYAVKSGGTAWAWGYYPQGLSNGVYSAPVQIGTDTNHVSASYGNCNSYQVIKSGSTEFKIPVFITSDGNLIGYSGTTSTQKVLYKSGSAVAITQNYNESNLDDTNTNTYLIKYIV